MKATIGLRAKQSALKPLPQPMTRSAKRALFRRILYLHRAMQRGDYPNSPTVGDHFGVDESTIDNDIEFMRSELQFPIEYDRSHHGYFYTKPCVFIGTTLTKTEIARLMDARELTKAVMGTCHEPLMQSLYEKLKEQFGFGPGDGFEMGRRWLSFRPFAPDKVDPRTFETVDTGLREHRIITFLYRALDSDEVLLRTVEPLCLAALPGSPYLIGYDHLRNQRRVFQLKRMKFPSLTNKTFKFPENFDVDEFMGDSFKMWHGPGKFEVHLTLDRYQVDRDCDRLWPKNWKYVENADGTADMWIKINDLKDLLSFATERGSHVKVHSPPEFVQMVKEEHRKAWQQYD